MKIRNEVKIGAIALVAFVLGYLGLNFLKGINLFEPENKYHVHLEDLNGTTVATPVMISGYKVGSVQKVEFGYKSGKGYGADLLLGLDPGVRVPKGSNIRIKTNVLSGTVLEIDAPITSEKGFYNNGDEIPVVMGDDIVSTVTDKVLPQILEMLPELMAMMKRFNEMAQNPAIDSTMINISRSTLQLNKAMAQINAAIKPMPQVMNNVHSLSESLVKVGHSVERLPLDSLVNNLNATSTSLRHMSAQLKNQEGTAGKLLNDPSLYNRLDSLANSADALMKDLKANPKRYVHFSLF